MSWSILHDRDTRDWARVHIVTNGHTKYACETQNDAEELKRLLERVGTKSPAPTFRRVTYRSGR
jgi:hypothetical protein